MILFLLGLYLGGVIVGYVSMAVHYDYDAEGRRELLWDVLRWPYLLILFLLAIPDGE